eukprot:9172501-Lingulodinium_polyedra.AAC.1
MSRNRRSARSKPCHGSALPHALQSLSGAGSPASGECTPAPATLGEASAMPPPGPRPSRRIETSRGRALAEDLQGRRAAPEALAGGRPCACSAARRRP